MDLPMSIPSFIVLLYVTAISREWDGVHAFSIVSGRINDPKKGQAAKITLLDCNIEEIFKGAGYQKRTPHEWYRHEQKGEWLTPEDERVAITVELPEKVILKGGHLIATAVSAKLPNGGILVYKED